MPTPAQIALDRISPAMAKTNGLFNSEVFGKRNFDALNDIYTAAARILPPGAPMITGRVGIREFWTNLIETANATAAVLTSIEVIPTGEGVVEIGNAKLTVHPDAGVASEIEVKYVVYWKQEEGFWRWDVDIWNQSS